MNTRISRAAAACALLAGTSLSITAQAQTEQASTAALPPEQYAITPYGVDMRTGQYTFAHTDLSTGEADGLTLVRNNGHHSHYLKKPFGRASHNWDVFVVERRDPTPPYSGEIGQVYAADYTVSVYVNGRAVSSFKVSFPPAGTTSSLTSSSAGYGNLRVQRLSGGERLYTHTGPDGTVTEFRQISSNVSDGCGALGAEYGGRCGYASRIVRADGVTYDLQYENPASRVRLRRVTSNTGWTLMFEYHPVFDGWNVIAKACLANRTSQFVPGDLCPSNVPTTRYTYDANGFMTAFVDASGAQHGMSNNYQAGGPTQSYPAPYTFEQRFFKPGSGVPFLVNTYEVRGREEVVARQNLADGLAMNYQWDTHLLNDGAEEIAGGSFTRNNGAGGTVGVTVRYRTYAAPGNQGWQISPGPTSVTDPIERTTSGDYCIPLGIGGCALSQVKYWILPGGNRIDYTYSGFGNVTEVRRSGPGVDDIVTRATYNCANPKSCAKPVTTTDANGNVTEYTYAPEHGGVLTETGPAVKGVRPQKRYRYEQRYAWVLGASGGYERAGPPVWLLVREASCKTGAASGDGCAIPGDEVVTLYDYGPDSGPNNLLLRGKVEDAGGLNARTCYAYDAKGNRVSETNPNAGLTSCS